MGCNKTILIKNSLLLCAVLITSVSLKAQTWSEWFKQKKTKLKYIAQQIAAFKVYEDYLRQGYRIVDDGWSVINDIKHGDFDLHHNYFSSLKEVSHLIKEYGKITGITTLQLQILQTNDNIEKIVHSNKYLQTQEINYINKILNNLLNNCTDDLNELQILTKSGSVSMKDDERLQRIDNLYANMRDKYAFTKHFESSVRVLTLLRARVSNDINRSQLLYGTK